MFDNGWFPSPPSSLAPDTEAFIGSFDGRVGDVVEVQTHVQGDWGDNFAIPPIRTLATVCHPYHSTYPIGMVILDWWIWKERYDVGAGRE